MNIKNLFKYKPQTEYVIALKMLEILILKEVGDSR